MPRPSKDERNKDIVKKYQAGWSYRRIAAHFNLHFTTIQEIIERWLPIYTGKKIK